LPVGGIGAVAGLVHRAEASTAAAESVIRRAVSTAVSEPSPSTPRAAGSPTETIRRSASTLAGPTTFPSSPSVIRRTESAPEPSGPAEPTSTQQRERLDRLMVDLERRLRREAERRRWRYGEHF
jgi:hypothetical protein